MIDQQKLFEEFVAYCYLTFGDIPFGDITSDSVFRNFVLCHDKSISQIVRSTAGLDLGEEEVDPRLQNLLLYPQLCGN